MTKLLLPKIVLLFNSEKTTSRSMLYIDFIERSLQKVISANLDHEEKNQEFLKAFRDTLQDKLPFFEYSEFGNVPFNFSFSFLIHYSPNAFKFFFEMVSRWLAPGKRLNVLHLSAADFKMPEIDDRIYTFCDLVLRIENEADLEKIRYHIPIIETELKIGVKSPYNARKILEIKGMTADEKTASIQEYIAYLIERLPKDFDQGLLSEMQHVLVTCPQRFKTVREGRHLARLICVHYLFRKSLLTKVKTEPKKRHLSLKLLRARLHEKEREEKVLGLVVGLNFFTNKEIIEEKHLLQAISHYVPDVVSISGSFYANRHATDKIALLYLEIKKADGRDFTLEETRALKRELPQDLKGRIEQLIHPVFMPRNEEEVMRHILTLSNQIKYVRDIPQVVITFDEQTNKELFFTVIWARVIKPGTPSIQEVFKSSKTILTYQHDRCKQVGFVRKRYPKEATVFHVKLSKERFLRGDHSINLYKARQTVVVELVRLLGEFRDFNGGMISKQNELFFALKNLVSEAPRYNELLLENFFYSLQPVIMRSLLDPYCLKTLFYMLLDLMEENRFKKEKRVCFKSEESAFYALISGYDRGIKTTIAQFLQEMKIPSSSLVTAFVTVHEIPYVGYLYRSDSTGDHKQFQYLLEKALKFNQDKERNAMT